MKPFDDLASICALELEDYIALKQRAYDYVARGNGRDMKTVNNYVQNVLEHSMSSAEGIIFSSTAMYPMDVEIFQTYYEVGEDFAKFEKCFSNQISSKTLLLKSTEIEKFHLDVLIQTGVLVPPLVEDTIKKERKI